MVNGLAPYERRIGMVFQNYALWPHMTVAENIGYGLRLRRLRGADLAQRLQEGLRKVNLVGFEARYPGQLSGGQQQRVAIARALVNDPTVILADEPTGALDTRTSLEIMALLQGLNQQGMTIVLVTHELDVAAHAGRILSFRDGRVIRDERIATPRNAAATLADLPRDLEHEAEEAVA